jgi:hypothetical protein
MRDRTSGARDVGDTGELEFAVRSLNGRIIADPRFAARQHRFAEERRAHAAPAEEKQRVAVFEALGDLLHARRQVAGVPRRA